MGEIDVGWLLLAGLLGMAALAYGIVWLPDFRVAFFEPILRRIPRTSTTPTAPPSMPSQGHTSHVAPHAQWWPAVVNEAHHLLLVGSTQSGKTTTACALLCARAQRDHILVIDPHAKLSPWQCDAVGTGRDWDGIDAALVALETEMSRRYAPSEAIGEPLTIFIDEWPAIAANCRNAKRVFLALAQEGAKVRMRLVVLTQQPTVEALGIPGQGDARNNFSRLLLGSFATKLAEAAIGRWAAVLDHQGQVQAVDRGRLPGLVQTASNCQVWQPPEPEPGTVSVSSGGAVSTPETPGNGRELSEKQAAAIRKLHAAGISKNVILELIPGNRARMLAAINAAMDEGDHT